MPVPEIVKVIADGPQGATGPQGPTGPGVPTGGTTAQILKKVSSDNYDTIWATPADGTSLDDGSF